MNTIFIAKIRILDEYTYAFFLLFLVEARNRYEPYVLRGL
jgi:hypothetical protein